MVKNQPPNIPQFPLSLSAKGGVFIRNLHDQDGEGDHAVTKPHRDTHYLLMLATQGQFTLNIDFEEVNFTAPALLFVVPGQVHHILKFHEPRGWTISVDPPLLDTELQFVLEKSFRGPLLVDDKTAFYQQTVTLLELMEAIQSGPSDTYTGKTTRALLDALLCLIAGLISGGTSDMKSRESRGILIEQAFSKLLSQHFISWKQPARYAAELAISVSHLNDMVKEITGTSVSTHIQQRAILEAKRLLYFTSLSVKEISYAVGYDEPVYFGKLFKKVTGLTPRHFRHQFRD